MPRRNPSQLPPWEKGLLNSVRTAVREADEAAELRDSVIVSALDADCMVNRVAEAAGLTRNQLFHRYGRHRRKT